MPSPTSSPPAPGGSRPPASLPVRVGRMLFDAPYVLLTCTALLWAINIVLGRFIAGHAPPITLAFVRWSVATLILLPFARSQLRRDLPLIRGSLPFLILLSATGIACYNAMSYYGLQYTNAINGLLVQSMTPVMIALWSFALFRERLTLGQAAGVLVSLVGVLLIIGRGDPLVLIHLDLNVGDIWFLVALVIYAFYASILRNRPPLGSLSFLTVIMGLGSIILFPFALGEWLLGKRLVLDAPTLSVLAYIAVGPSILAYLCFNRGVELVGPNRAAPFLHLMPVFGTALAIVFLGEAIAWFHFAGYALVIGGIALATLSARRPQKGEAGG